MAVFSCSACVHAAHACAALCAACNHAHLSLSLYLFPPFAFVSVGSCCTNTACTQAGQRLKAEGNQLHSAGSYQAALEKYERAKNNVSYCIPHTPTCSTSVPAVMLTKARLGSGRLFGGWASPLVGTRVTKNRGKIAVVDNSPTLLDMLFPGLLSQI
eukprot:1159946-Pelagomonas_calceolata.AAC.6